MTAALASLTPPISVEGGLDLATARGYRPLKHGAKETGFDLVVGKVDEDDVEDYKADLASSGESDTGFLEVLSTSDTLISVSGKDPAELSAAKAVVEVIANLCNGYLYDPQAGAVLRAIARD